MFLTQQTEPVAYYALPPTLTARYQFLESQAKREGFNPFDPEVEDALIQTASLGRNRAERDEANYQLQLIAMAQEADEQVVNCGNGGVWFELTAREEELPIERLATDVYRDAGGNLIHNPPDWESADTRILTNGSLATARVTDQLLESGVPLLPPRELSKVIAIPPLGWRADDVAASLGVEL